MFDPSRLYFLHELGEIAPTSTLSKWRHYGVGPAYVKLGGRVRYKGDELNRWIEERSVYTADAPPPQPAA